MPIPASNSTSPLFSASTLGITSQEVPASNGPSLSGELAIGLATGGVVILTVGILIMGVMLYQYFTSDNESSEDLERGLNLYNDSGLAEGPSGETVAKHKRIKTGNSKASHEKDGFFKDPAAQQHHKGHHQKQQIDTNADANPWSFKY